MRRVTKTTPPMTPPTIAPVLVWEPPLETAPTPVEDELGLDEVDDMELLVVETEIEGPVEDCEVELGDEPEVESEADVLVCVVVEDAVDIEVVEEEGVGTGEEVVVVGRPGDADATDEDVLEPRD